MSQPINFPTIPEPPKKPTDPVTRLLYTGIWSGMALFGDLRGSFSDGDLVFTILAGLVVLFNLILILAYADMIEDYRTKRREWENTVADKVADEILRTATRTTIRRGL